MEIVKDIKSALISLDKEIHGILTKDFRDDLNKNVHILDLSYHTLLSATYSRTRNKLSDNEQSAYASAYSTLIEVLLKKCAGRIFTSITDPGVKELIDKKFATGPILLYLGGTGPNTTAFLVGSQFKSLQSYYSTNIAGSPELRTSRFGKSTVYKQKKDAKGRVLKDEYTKESRIKVDFGHIPTPGDQNLTSPLAEKFKAVFNTTTDERIKRNAAAALDELYTIQASVAHRFHNTTPEVIEASRKLLGQGYVVVTLQNKALNSKFSTEEARIYSKLLRSIVNKIDYTSISGSNTIRQDIAQMVASIFSGKKLRKHKDVSASTKVVVKSKSKVSSSATNLQVSKPREVVSQINLLAILQAAINKQVAKNMGTGSEHRILNYRTGRFAESVDVQKISESRQGMISVFYSYMKNPYATFSEGGRQQYPKTRDPKLLISQSIRDIATPIVGNRLRSVVV